MKTNTYFKIGFLILFTGLFFSCARGPIGPEGPQGTPGSDAVIYSEWFSPSSWSGSSGDWYFDASAPDLTSSIVEQGVILGYVWLVGDLYKGAAVRPLPANAVDANWSFLIPGQYGKIEFTCDATDVPNTSNQFRFIAIPGGMTALKSAPLHGVSLKDLKSMPYKDVCGLLGVPE
jgi:hypothetical protein